MIKSVRVFDTILSSRNIKDTSSRNSADFWKAFCASSGWGFNYERVHSLTDLNYFFNRKIKEDVIIFSGHGWDDGFHLTNGDVFNLEDKSIDFPDKNKGKIIIFSSCYIGKNRNLMYKFREFFDASYVFAYKHVMYDRYCFLNESILLSMMEQKFDKGKGFNDSDFDRFVENTMFMKNMNTEGVKTHPMEMVKR